MIIVEGSCLVRTGLVAFGVLIYIAPFFSKVIIAVVSGMHQHGAIAMPCTPSFV